MKLLDRSKVNKILVVSLTNIGDVILTFPVIDALREDFPSAKLSVVIGPKAESLLCGNPHIEKIYVFNKHQPPLKSLSWIIELRGECFDLVVDLRNTAIPLMIAPRYRTSCRAAKTFDGHMRKKHLDRLWSVYKTEKGHGKKYALYISEADKSYVRGLIDTEIGRKQKYVIVAAGAADSSKRWPEKNFASVCDHLTQKHNIKIVFVGDDGDRRITQRVNEMMAAESVDLCARTNLVQLAELLLYCTFALTNDSAPMHLASYLDVPVLVLFGPSDPKKYGPWGKNGRMIKKSVDCPACINSKSTYVHTCMSAISKEDVLDSITNLIMEPHGSI